MTVRVLEVAQQELDEAIAYYNGQAPGLGDAFLLETVATIDRIRRFPKAWHPLGESVRRCRLRRFPYGLIYQEDKGEILIVAVAHSHRRPDPSLLPRVYLGTRVGDKHPCVVVKVAENVAFVLP